MIDHGDFYKNRSNYKINCKTITYKFLRQIAHNLTMNLVSFLRFNLWVNFKVKTLFSNGCAFYRLCDEASPAIKVYNKTTDISK